MIIFMWKLRQGLVSGYDIIFTSMFSSTGRKAAPSPIGKGPACRRKSREGSFRIKGVALFNSLPASIRNCDHGDIDMFKNHLDHYLSTITDQPYVTGLVRAAQSNSLLHKLQLVDTIQH